MFFCDDCAKQRNWPTSIMGSYGTCEVCGATARCSDVASSNLPLPVARTTESARIAPAATLPPQYITEETIATFYDHLKGANAVAIQLLEKVSLTPHQAKQLESILDSWTYCKRTLLANWVPYRDR
jgi:hypothetical protein